MASRHKKSSIGRPQGEPPAPRLLAVLAAASCVAAHAARAGDFVDTRVTFAVSNPNVLAAPGETNPSNPGTRIGGDKNNKLFFDNYETRDSGFETLSHLVLFKEGPSFVSGLDAGAALVLRLQVIDERTTTLGDDGSYVTLRYSWLDDPRLRVKENFSLTLFPVSGDRFRLGYSYRLSWGGSSIFTSNNVGHAAPAVKAQITVPSFYYYVGLKTADLLEQDINEVATNVGVLSGLGWDIAAPLRFELNGGWFQRGVNPMQAVLGEPVDAYGASAQLTVHEGIPITTSIDLRLYENDPRQHIDYFTEEQYGPGFSYLIAAEVSSLWQTLQDPAQAASTVRQQALAGDLQAKLKYEKFRAFLTGELRTLQFILFNVPSFSPFVDVPESVDVTPEYFFAGGFDYYFPGPRLTPGISAGVLFPASYTGNVNAGNNPSPTLTGTRTQVVREAGDVAILPDDASPVPITALKLGMKWLISPFLVGVLEVQGAIDDNQTTLVDDQYGVATRRYSDPYRFGFNVMLQARF